VPVVVGTAAAGHISVWRTVAALVVAVGLQVGVNYANDYSDGVSGVDSPARVGPTRLVASGLAPPRSVATAAGLALGVAAVAGTALALATSPWLLVVGAGAIAAALLYSGGPRPYAGLGLGELAVFVFFGLVATCGTAYVQSRQLPGRAWWGAVSVGLLAVAVLVANNLRDIQTDTAAGKRTLAVRIGDPSTRLLYRGLVGLALVTPAVGVLVGALPVTALLALGALPFARKPLRLCRTARGGDLVAVLTGTAGLQAVFGLLLGAGLVVS